MKFITALACTLMAFAAICAPALQEKNMFKNGDFANGLNGWRYENKAICIVADMKVDGKAVVKIPGKSEIRQNFIIKDNTDYILTYIVKAENIQSANPHRNGARFMLNANKRWQRSTPMPGGICMTGTFDWKKGEYRFNSTKDFGGGGKLTIKLMSDCEGTLYAADIKLIEVAK